MIRNLCEAYNKTPSQLQNETPDQLFILAARKVDLARLGGVSHVSLADARELGVVKTPHGGGSLVQRIRAEAKAKSEKEQKMTKRERRREFDRQLAERRARGEKI